MEINLGKDARIGADMKGDKKSILPGAVMAAFLAAVIVYCILLNVEKNMLSSYEKGTVVAAAGKIVKGTILDKENMAEYLVELQMDKKLIPESVYTDQEQLLGLMASWNIEKGSVITEAVVQTGQEIEAELAAPVVAGFKAEDLFQVVSGTLRSGDRIHIYIVDEEGGSTCLAWENVLVRQVFDNGGMEIESRDKTAAAHRVNILLERESVEQFYNELARGSLRVVKVFE